MFYAQRYSTQSSNQEGGGRERGGRQQARDEANRHKSAQGFAETKAAGYLRLLALSKELKYQGAHSQLFFQTIQSDTLALRGFNQPGISNCYLILAYAEDRIIQIYIQLHCIKLCAILQHRQDGDVSHKGRTCTVQDSYTTEP